MTRPPNQRDAQKRATRLALSGAAIDLFTTKGFDETRVEDIAAAVGVSSRTFFLHFPSKEAAAFPDHDERVDALAEALASDTAEDPLPLLRSLVVLGVTATADSRTRAKRYRLFNEIAPLRERDILGDLEYEQVIVDHLTSRWGASPAVEFRARTIAVAAMGIARSALTTWAHDPSFDPTAAAELALEELR
ncbi:MAG: TetR family transcriptional regulator [Acidimicrobiales bacterium]